MLKVVQLTYRGSQNCREHLLDSEGLAQGGAVSGVIGAAGSTGRQRAPGSALACGSWWSDALDGAAKAGRASRTGFPLGVPQGRSPLPHKAVVLFRVADPENPAGSSWLERDRQTHPALLQIWAPPGFGEQTTKRCGSGSASCGDAGGAPLAPSRPGFRSCPWLSLPVWPTQNLSVLIGKIDPRTATLPRWHR